MSPLDLFFLLRRHKWVLVVAVVVGICAGWLTAPGASDAPKEYVATHTLIQNSQIPSGLNLDQAALLATTGAVPNRAARTLGVDVGQITGAVTATADRTVASIRVTGRSIDPDFAEQAADAVADALVSDLSGSAQLAYEAALAELEQQAEQLRARISAGGTTAAAQAEVGAAQSDLSAVLQQVNALTAQGPPAPELLTVDRASARAATVSGISAPDSKPARAMLLGGFGLLVGLAAVFALDRLDTRIHTKSGAEAAFGFPVIAEIPPLPAGVERQLLAQTRPSSQFVEAYRGLRTHIAFATEEHGLRPQKPGTGRVILLTSPLAGEGKTTSVAHLAAMLGEVGRSVLVVSGDFRRPRLHELFQRNRTPGLTEVLSGAVGAPDITSLDLSTPVKGVQFVASGAPVSNPAVVVKQTPAVLDAARPFWEFLLVDSAPLLVANDSAELARCADGVVVLARSGRTTIDAAERSAELLRRIEAPVIGVVLISSDESPTAYRYYRTNYFADDSEPKRRWRRGGGAARRSGGRQVAPKHQPGSARSAPQPQPWPPERAGTPTRS